MSQLPLCLLLIFTLRAHAQVWTLTSAPSTNWSAIACSADGERLVAAVGSRFGYDLLPGPIFRSTNSGGTWNITGAPITDWGVIASSAEGYKVAGALYGYSYGLGPRVYTSSDTGLTWSASSGAPVTNRWIVLASSADGSVLAASDPTGGHVPGAVMISTDAGATWTWSLHDFETWTSVACSADGKTIVASSTRSRFYRSMDSGTNWDVLETLSGLVTLSADASKLIALYAGGISVSTNLGDTWQTIAAPNIQWGCMAASADAKTIVAAPGIRYGYEPTIGPIYFSTNSGATWVSANSPSAVWTSVACSADGAKLFATSVNGSIYSLQFNPAPQLSITLSGAQLVLSWLVPSKPFVLQRSAGLVASDWVDVLTSPMLNLTNLQNEVSIPVPTGTSFYRLESR